MFDIEQHEKEWRESHPNEFCSNVSKSAQLIIKNSRGLIKTEKQANVIMIIFILAMVTFALSLLFKGNYLYKEQEFKDMPVAEKGSPNFIPE